MIRAAVEEELRDIGSKVINLTAIGLIILVE